MKLFLNARTNLSAAFIVLLVAGFTEPADAQDSTIFVARVFANANIATSANSVGGTVTASNPSTGQYLVKIEAAGAFTGLSAADLLPQVTIEALGFTDLTAATEIVSVSSDEIQVRVRIGDAEDATFLSLPEERDNTFFLALFRAPQSGSFSAGSRFLLATGTMVSNGDLISAVGLDGMTIETERDSTGEYSIHLRKSGQFVDDDKNSYVLMLEAFGSGAQDNGIAGTADPSASNDEVRFSAYVSDLQDTSDDDVSQPENRNIAFVIYRTTPSLLTATPSSKLLLAMARVDNTGTKLVEGTSEPGMTITTSRPNTGEFNFTLNKPGFFAGLDQYDLVPLAQVESTGLSGNVAIVFFSSITSDEVTLRVFVSDVEQAAESEGVPANSPLSVVIYDTRADRITDLRIGKKNNISRQAGAGRLNASGAGQRTTIRGVGKRPLRFFFSVQNSGTISDSPLLRGIASKKHLKPKYFVFAGGKQNVTAAMKGAGYLATGTLPDAFVSFESRTKFKGRSTKRRQNMRIACSSGVAASTGDVILAKLKRAPVALQD